MFRFLQSLAIFGIAYGVAWLATPIVISLGARLGALDRPGGRKTHEGEIPRLGGVAVAGAVTVAMLPGLLLPDIQVAVARNVAFLGVLLCGGGIVFGLGLWDDVKGTNAKWKFFFQTIAAVVVCQAGFGFHTLNVPILGSVELGAWGWAISILWVVGVTNAVNLIDGLDGLAAGLAFIMCASVGVTGVLRGEAVTPLLCAALSGALLAFLRFNWNPARVFLGDCGSMFIGYLLAVLAMRSTSKGPTAVAITVPILALGVPVIDTLLVMALRFRGEEGASFPGRVLRMFRADRNHLHHLLLDTLRGHHRAAVSTIYLLGILFAGSAIAVAYSNNLEQGVTLVALAILAVAAGRIEARRRSGPRETEADGFRRAVGGATSSDGLNRESPRSVGVPARP